MSKQFIVGSLVGGVTVFILGSIFYAVLFSNFFESNIPEGMEMAFKKMPNLVYIFLSNLSLGILLTFLMEKLEISTFSKGASFSLIVGLLIALFTDLMMGATTNLVTPIAGIVDVALITTIATISGGVIALVLGKMNKNLPL